MGLVLEMEDGSAGSLVAVLVLVVVKLPPELLPPALVQHEVWILQFVLGQLVQVSESTAHCMTVELDAPVDLEVPSTFIKV